MNIVNKIFFLLFVCIPIYAQQIQQTERLENEQRVLNEATDFHLNAPTDVIKKGSINLSTPDAWLFFDNVRPSVVSEQYAKYILVNGVPLKTGDNGNGRLAIYKQGTVVIPHSPRFHPLETFTETHLKGEPEAYGLHHYYTNKPDESVPAEMVQPLEYDNSIQSFRLKKGYMATFATEPDGLGYSRVFIADREDLVVAELPVELRNKISFIRVFPWQWPSKKGWCGSSGSINEENGKDKKEYEIELTESTWYYSWGVDDHLLPDAEFVPMKWGYGGNIDKINARREVTHLLGHNEPNRPDQADMTVAQALEEWPQLLKSGLRLGSPSVSDNSRLEDWLYKFIDECDKRNYRVDYVAVHGYWGVQQMPTPESWYKTLFEIHQRTGRPLWLTEWNIGANWTKETWPAEEKEQFEKHERDLKQILAVLDTASFVERYSIYNWVEDKRAVIIDSLSYKMEDGRQVTDKLLKQVLTPAGKLYRNNQPTFAYNPQQEFIPGWIINGAPVLTFELSERDEILLQWKVNGYPEMNGNFIVERSVNGKEFEEINRISPVEHPLFFESLLLQDEVSYGTVCYRIRMMDLRNKNSVVSNVISYNYLPNKNNEPTVTRLITGTNWSMQLFNQPYASQPIVISGTPTYTHKVPQTHRINQLTNRSFHFKLATWEYLKNPVSNNQDTIACLILPGTGEYNWQGITAISGKVTIGNQEWSTVYFDTPFKEVPVVFASQVTNQCSYTTSVRVRNVTAEGFDIQLQYERALTPPQTEEDICYLAVTPGTGNLNGKKIQVGKTEENVAGDFFNAGKITVDKLFKWPAIFTFMQTVNDNIPSALRIKSQQAGQIEIFKEKEASKTSGIPVCETVGWMLIEN